MRALAGLDELANTISRDSQSLRTSSSTRSTGTIRSFSRGFGGIVRSSNRPHGDHSTNQALAQGVQIICVRPDQVEAWGSTLDIPSLQSEGYGEYRKTVRMCV